MGKYHRGEHLMSMLYAELESRRDYWESGWGGIQWEERVSVWRW